MSATIADNQPKNRRGRGKSWAQRVVVIIVTAMGLVMGLSTVASADVVTEGPGVRARADWNWGSSPYSLSNISLGVRDLACDGHAVGVRLRLYYQYGGSWLTDLREHHGGCNSAQNWDTYYNANYVIAGVRVVGCVIDGRCYESEYHPRP